MYVEPFIITDSLYQSNFVYFNIICALSLIFILLQFIQAKTEAHCLTDLEIHQISGTMDWIEKIFPHKFHWGHRSLLRNEFDELFNINGL